MYKMLFFLHKECDENAKDFFSNKIVNKLKEITSQNIEIAQVESNLLLEQKFSLFCEVFASSKEEMDRFMYSKAGKELNKYMTEFHKNITVIEVNYDKVK